MPFLPGTVVEVMPCSAVPNVLLCGAGVPEQQSAELRSSVGEWDEDLRDALESFKRNSARNGEAEGSRPKYLARLFSQIHERHMPRCAWSLTLSPVPTGSDLARGTGRSCGLPRARTV